MNIKLYSKLSQLLLADNFPNAPENLLLPGAHMKVAIGPQKHYYYLFQEFKTEWATIRFCNFFSAERVSITVVTDEPAITFRFATFRSHRPIVQHPHMQAFHERSYNCFYVPQSSIEYLIEHGESFNFIDIIINNEYAHSIESYSEKFGKLLKKVSQKIACKIQLHNQVAPIEVLRWIDELMIWAQDLEKRGTMEKYIQQLIIQSLVTIQSIPIKGSGKLDQQTINKLYQAAEIIKYSEKGISLEELANMVGLSVYKLKTGFKAIYGHSVSKHRLEESWRLALRMIGNKQYSEKVLAEMLGYSSEQTFSRQFKRRFGYPPYRLGQNGRILF